MNSNVALSTHHGSSREVTVPVVQNNNFTPSQKAMAFALVLFGNMGLANAQNSTCAALQQQFTDLRDQLTDVTVLLNKFQIETSFTLKDVREDLGHADSMATGAFVCTFLVLLACCCGGFFGRNQVIKVVQEGN